MMSNEEFWKRHWEEKEMVEKPDTPVKDTHWYNRLRLDVLEDELRRTIRRDLRSNTKSGTGSFLWITINPRPCTTGAFVNSLEKIVKKKWIASSRYLYVIEQRKDASYYEGDDIDYINNGKHCHMIVEAKKKKNHALREIYSTMKSICTKESIDIKVCPMEYLDDKKNYCLGKKTGDGKDVKQEGDKIYREKKNLAEYYSSCQLLNGTLDT